ncbi:Hint domain-containing protein [Celeribacter litoreus]|uniref:Hint domain-containing protein n=1 Tax=Celeribacter litoreus TaxID=2876714 RepID=UPI001CCA6BBA|nr:Hint domain-containing protein [Celeribacter litoreus]MCA0045222.1 Hint domain-containing protein [Celeribacter litoreus]
MSETTIYVYEVDDITVETTDGKAVKDVLEDSLWGDAFSWENPDDLVLTLPDTPTAVTYEDSDGFLQDDPYSGSNVTDQMLTSEVRLNNTKYRPSTGTVRWDKPTPVTVESEYSVDLIGSDGITYTLVGISITEGYDTEIVGVAFDGAQPPLGVTLTYFQGNTTYNSSGPSLDPAPTVPCFAAGTKIQTPSGEVPIQHLKAGDLVSTLDHGPRPILWIGRSTVDGRANLAPIEIAKGALGNRNSLKVSPNHRFLLQGAEIEILFAEDSVFAPAKALVNDHSIRPAPCPRVTYFHILLSGHEVIFAEGIATESLFTGPMAMEALDDDARTEIHKIFEGNHASKHILSRPEITMTEAAALQHNFNYAPGHQPARFTCLA